MCSLIRAVLAFAVVGACAPRLLAAGDNPGERVTVTDVPANAFKSEIPNPLLPGAVTLENRASQSSPIAARPAIGAASGVVVLIDCSPFAETQPLRKFPTWMASDLLDVIPDSMPTSFICFGQQERTESGKVEVVRPLAPLRWQHKCQLRRYLHKLRGTSTEVPVILALQAAKAQMAGKAGAQPLVVLITDGDSTDGCESEEVAARMVREADVQLPCNRNIDGRSGFKPARGSRPVVRRHIPPCAIVARRPPCHRVGQHCGAIRWERHRRRLLPRHRPA